MIRNVILKSGSIPACGRRSDSVERIWLDVFNGPFLRLSGVPPVYGRVAIGEW